jgi:hypothetical protein
MNKNLQHTKLISSKEGWQQMQVLLNQHLPSKPQNRHLKWMVTYIAATIFILLLLCVSLQLDTVSLRIPLVNNIHLPQLTASQQAAVKKGAKQISPFPILPVSKNSYADASTKNIFSSEDKENKLITAIEPGCVTIDKHLNGAIERVSPQKQTATVIGALPVWIHPHQNDNISKAKAKASWNFYAGAGLNVNVNNPQQLQPYPHAEARYNLKRNFYFAIGLTAWSPVSTIAGGVSKTVYLNDTVNNIRLYNEVTTYRRLQYADIPLSAGLHLTKHLSVSGGIQLSVLMNKQTKSILEPYDYQMNNVTGLALPVAVNGRAGLQYNVQPKNTDYRYIAGVQYTDGNITGSLIYQHAFKPAGYGPGSKNNNLVSFRMLFKIK